MNKKIKRDIDDEMFWYNFYQNNTIKLNSLQNKIIKGSKFTDSLFNVKNNQEIFVIKYNILDRDNKVISNIVYNILKRNLSEDLVSTDSLIQMLKYEMRILEPANLIERTLLSVYASENEANILDVNFGNQILLIKTKYYQNSEIILYKEEYTNLNTFIFEDKYHERVSI